MVFPSFTVCTVAIDAASERISRSFSSIAGSVEHCRLFELAIDATIAADWEVRRKSTITRVVVFTCSGLL